MVRGLGILSHDFGAPVQSRGGGSPFPSTLKTKEFKNSQMWTIFVTLIQFS